MQCTVISTLQSNKLPLISGMVLPQNVITHLHDCTV